MSHPVVISFFRRRMSWPSADAAKRARTMGSTSRDRRDLRDGARMATPPERSWTDNRRAAIVGRADPAWQVCLREWITKPRKDENAKRKSEGRPASKGEARSMGRPRALRLAFSSNLTPPFVLSSFRVFVFLSPGVFVIPPPCLDPHDGVRPHPRTSSRGWCFDSAVSTLKRLQVHRLQLSENRIGGSPP